MYRRIIVSYSSINKYFSCQSNYFTNYETMQEPNHMPGNRAPLFWEMLHKLKYLSCFGMSREKLQQLWKSHCFLFNRLHSGLFLSQKRGKNLKTKSGFKFIWERLLFDNCLIFFQVIHFSEPKQTTVKVYCIFLFFLWELHIWSQENNVLFWVVRTAGHHLYYVCRTYLYD